MGRRRKPPRLEPRGGRCGDEVAELKSTLQRVKAEYDNYRKRALRDQQLVAERTKAAVVTQLLPVLDDLDRARSHGDLESGPLKSVADKLATALEGLGFRGSATRATSSTRRCTRPFSTRATARIPSSAP